MSREMTLDQFFQEVDNLPERPQVPSMTEEVRRVVQRAKAETADEASAYFLHAMLLAIENLAQGNKLVAGRAFDDALTHFLADLKAELGGGFAANAAALLIRNIALFLDGRKRDMVLAALDVEGKSQ